MSSCTGSLITASWFVSAVHCTLFPKNQDAQKCGPTKKLLKVQGVPQTISCEDLPNGDTKLITYDPPSMVWLGVSNMAKDVAAGTAVSIKVEYIIQPKGAYYQGGTYGTFGGYDIIIGKLESPAPAKFTPACLPSPTFNDIGKSNLAGYGKSSRGKCITNSYGPMKSHFCSTDDELEKSGYKKRDHEGWYLDQILAKNICF